MSDGTVRQKQEDEVFCSSCGAIIKRVAEICPKCGVRQRTAQLAAAAKKAEPAEVQTAPKANTAGIQADEAFCSSCGAIIKKAAEICPKCGVRQRMAPVSGNKASPNKSVTDSVRGIIKTASDKIPGLNYIALILGIGGIVHILVGLIGIVIGIIISIPMSHRLFGSVNIVRWSDAVTLLINGLMFFIIGLGFLKIDKLLKAFQKP